MSDFNIEQEGITIMTNNSDNMFNTTSDEQNIILDSGNNFMSIDTNGFTDTFADTVKFDNPPPQLQSSSTTQPQNSFQPSPTTQLQPPTPPSRNQRNDSINSTDTIDLDTIKKKKTEIKKEKPVEKSFMDFSDVDDILDPKKLKPVSESQQFMKDDMTIREPASPTYTEMSSSPLRPHYATEKQSQKQSSPEQTFSSVPKYSSEYDEKLDLLTKLQSLSRMKGIEISKHYDMKSSVDDLRVEYKRQKDIIDTEASVKFMRKGLVFCTSGIEYMNRRFDPLGAKLDGWSESVMENVMDYDGIFERLAMKYTGSMQMEPEMELLFALGGSAFMFHLTNTFFKGAGNQFGKVLGERPELMQGLMGALKESSRRDQQQQSVPFQQAYQNQQAHRQGQAYQQQNQPMEAPSFNLGSLLSQIGIQGVSPANNAGSLGSSDFMANPPPFAQDTRKYEEPPLTDIYRKMINQQQDDTVADIYRDTVSVASDSSERSIGSAVITKSESTKKGGKSNVIIKL